MEEDEDLHLPLGEAFEAETLERAKRGDPDAGKEALQICIAGLYANRLSEATRFYLAQCLIDVADGMKPTRALNIEEERGRGRPKDPFPDWEMPLAAFAALLHRRGHIPARIEEAMSSARQTSTGKDLDPREARRIRKKYRSMESLDDDLLIQYCGDDMRGEIQKYPPAT